MAKKKAQKTAPKKTKSVKVVVKKTAGKKLAAKKPENQKPAKAKPETKKAPTLVPFKASPAKNLSSIFTPLDDRVVVLRDAEETTTASGLIIPGTSAEKPTRGKVVAVGMGEFNKKKNRRRPMEVKVGERVLFSQFAGTPLQIGAQEYIIMRESELLGIID